MSKITEAFQVWNESRFWGSNPAATFELRQAFGAGWKAALKRKRLDRKFKK